MTLSLTPELRASPPTCYLPPGVPEKNPSEFWNTEPLRPPSCYCRGAQGSEKGRSLSWARSSSEASSKPPAFPPAAWCLHCPWVLTTPLSPVSPPPPTAQGTVQEPGTYQDKEQKSWGKEAKSHLHSGVGPFSFAPLKFQIPVCGQSPNFLTI